MTVGAGVRQASLLEWPELGQSLRLAALALPWTGHAQTRSRGTVCGSIAHADPSAEMPLVLRALGGEVHLRSARRRRRVAAKEFFTGMMATSRADEELIEAVSFPADQKRCAFREVARRHGDFAIVACAAVATADGVRLAVGGVADMPAARDFPRLEASALDDALERVRLRARRARRCPRHRALSSRSRAHDRPRSGAGGAAMSRLPAGRRHSVRFTLNGKPCAGEAEPRMLLTDFLRHQIGVTGTHVGCEHGVCGACTVDIDGKPARACLTLAVQIDGSAVADGRKPRAVSGSPWHPASGVQAQPRASVRLLHGRHSDVARLFPARKSAAGRSGHSRFADGAFVPLHRLHADRARGPRSGSRNGGRFEQREVRCLILEPALSRVSRAIPTPWRSSTTAFA